mgnify:CR=1 FL=1
MKRYFDVIFFEGVAWIWRNEDDGGVAGVSPAEGVARYAAA